jgi:hypothetical protein
MAMRWGNTGTRPVRVVRRLAGAILALVFASFITPAAAVAADDESDAHADQRKWLEVSAELARHLMAREDPSQQLAAAFLLAHSPPKDAPADITAVAAARRAEAAAIFARVRAGTDDPWILWLAAGSCPFDASPCDSDAALDALQRIDGDNAAVWLVTLDRARTDGRRADALAALQAMAASSRFDTYDREGVRTWTDAFASLPSVSTWRLAGTMAAEGTGEARALSAEQERAVAALGGLSLAFAYNMPPITGFATACAPEQAASAEWQQACRGAAQVMIDSGHLLARMLGFPVAYRLAADDPAAQARYEVLRREQARIIDSFLTLQLDGFDADLRPDPAEAEVLLAAMRDRESELAMYRDLLQQHGLPLEPPASYQAPGETLAEREAQRQARPAAASARAR